MTNKEAIRILKYDPLRAEAMDMAIKALEQPEIIRCKDCKYWHNAPVSDGYDSCEKDALIRHEDFFCAEAKRREEGEQNG